MAKKDFDRVRAIREKANEARRIEQRATQKRAIAIQLSVIVGVLLVAGLVAAIVVFSNNNKVPQAVPEASGMVSLGGADDIPLIVARTSVSIGQADAPVTIDLYEDFSCPHCAQYEAAVGDTIGDMIAAGDVVVNYHPIRFVSPYGQSAGSAATCVAVEDPQSWWTVHAGLFSNHSATTDRWKAADFAGLAEDLGVDNQAALDCIRSQKYSDWIMSNTKIAQDDGVTSTPSLFINGTKVELLAADGLRAAVETAKQG